MPFYAGCSVRKQARPQPVVTVRDICICWGKAWAARGGPGGQAVLAVPAEGPWGFLRWSAEADKAWLLGDRWHGE